MKREIAGALSAPAPVLAGAAGLLGGMLFVVVAGQASPLQAVGVFLGVVIAVALVLNPTFGLFLTALVIPIERLGRLTEDTGTVTVSLMRIVGVLALGGFLVHALIRKEPLRVGPAVWLYGAYWTFALGGAFVAEDSVNAIRYSATNLGNLMFLLLLVNVVRSWRLAKIAVILWLLVSVAAGLYTIYGWHFGADLEDQQIGVGATRGSTTWKDASEWESLQEADRRAIGPTSHAAVYGINLILTLPFLAYVFRTHRSLWIRALVAAATMVIAYNLVLTNTRAVLLCSGVVGLLAVARRLLLLTPRAVVAGLLLGTAGLWLVPDTVFNRAFDFANYTVARSGTLRIRLEFWQAALEVAQQNWFAGAGLGNVLALPRLIRAEYVGNTASAHNEFLQTLIEVGVVGWLLFFGFVALVFWYSVQAARVYRRSAETQEQYWFMVACQVAMVGVLLYGTQVDVFHFPLKGWWLVAGISCVMYRLTRNVRG